MEYGNAHDKVLGYASQNVTLLDRSDDEEDQSALLPIQRKRHSAVTGTAFVVLKKRNKRITTQAVARLAKFYVPLQIASTVAITLGVIDTMLVDRDALKAVNVSLMASALTLQAYIVFREICGWIFSTLPLMRGELPSQGAAMTLFDLSMLAGLASYTAYSIVHQSHFDNEAKMFTFLLGVKLNLLFASLVISFNALFFLYNVVVKVMQCWSARNQSLEERLYTEASELDKQQQQQVTTASTAEGPGPATQAEDDDENDCLETTSLFNDDELSCSERLSCNTTEQTLTALIDKDSLQVAILSTWMHSGNAIQLMAKRMALAEIPISLNCSQCCGELLRHDQITEMICTENHFFHVRCLADLDDWNIGSCPLCSANDA